MLSYPWLNIIYNKILRSYYINKGHHALLIHSQQNYGEHILVNNIAQWLICENRYDMQYCNTCSSCCLMRTGNHPDYYQLNVDQNLQFIGVDKIRNCIHSLYTSPKCSSTKVVFIKFAENLTHQAANVLLKTVEEPPDNTYFFLSTRNNINIPITLSSRCIKWTIMPPIEEEGLQWLMIQRKEVDILSAHTALRLSYGSPIEADSMFQLHVWKYRETLCQTMKNVIINKNFLDLLPCLLINMQKYNYQSVYWLITILIDSLKWQQKIHKKFIINLDQLNLISNIAMQWKMLSLNNQVNQWLILFSYFQKFDNINRELLLTYRLLNWEKDIIETFL